MNLKLKKFLKLKIVKNLNLRLMQVYLMITKIQSIPLFLKLVKQTICNSLQALLNCFKLAIFSKNIVFNLLRIYVIYLFFLFIIILVGYTIGLPITTIQTFFYLQLTIIYSFVSSFIIFYAKYSYIYTNYNLNFLNLEIVDFCDYTILYYVDTINFFLITILINFLNYPLFFLFAVLFFITSLCSFIALSYLGLYGVFILNLITLISLWVSLWFYFVKIFSKNIFYYVSLGKWMYLNTNFKINFSFLIDSVSLSFSFLTVTIGVFAYVYTFAYFRYEPLADRLLILLNLFIISMVFLVSSGNLVMLFLGWEMIGLTSFFLINF